MKNKKININIKKYTDFYKKYNIENINSKGNSDSLNDSDGFVIDCNFRQF
ncbi:MAG: hypothetical protein LBS76_03835 [Mycoplasmataceae bacterium]|jgi:hypothetical protein|nr:hypothetical protein [Mycoplasmataceae bacterium]